ncbi:hypothetical protein ACFLQU_00190 [Verrucomicrobiota bacterium]
MIDKDIRERLEIVIEAFASADMMDVAELTRLYARLKEIEYLAQATSEPALDRTAAVLADLIRKAIIRETDNPEHYLRHAEARLAVLQLTAQYRAPVYPRLGTTAEWTIGFG